MTSTPSIQAALRSARLRARLARGVEHALAGGAAASVVLAAAALSGAPSNSSGALVVAAVSGVLALATLAFERRESALQFARRMDVRMGADGALATAFECEDDRDASPIARLHAQRTAARFRAADLRRAVPSPSPAFVAVLLLGAALVALARQTNPASRSEARELATAHGLPAGSGSRSSESNAGNAAVSESAASSESWETPSTGGGDATPSAAAERMQVPGSGSSGAGRESFPEPGAASSRAGSAPAGSPLAEATASASGAGAGPGSDARTLTGTSGGSTMSGPPPEPGMPTTANSPTTASASPAAAPSGRWWPSRHDAVVARYVERTRAALSAGAAPR